MNSFYVLTVVIALAIQVQGESYSTENDGFDMKAAVANVDILKGMVGCFLDTSPCTDAAAGLKKHYPDAVVTACTKCNDAQKGLMHTFLDGVKTKLPKEFEALKIKYDPEGKHYAELEANVAAY